MTRGSGLSPRTAGLVAALLLLVVYVATLAPSVTFWDAGEFIAAAHSLGIPHPPGTPLFVILLSAWARLFGLLPFAVATNLFSAVCTAAAGGLAAWWVAQRTGSGIAGLAGALAAGTMSSVWLNATETEVYAASLLLAMAAIVAADLAGARGERRWLVLAVYLLALAIPLHLSALVAAPVVLLLATDCGDGQRDWGAALAIAATTVIVVGVSRLSLAFVIVGTVLLIIAPTLSRDATRNSIRRDRVLLILAVVVAMTGLFYLPLRAALDPAINQANPATFDRVLYTIGRRQYALPGVWPRQAPVWIQVANWFEYADWQTALSLAPSVIPTIPRVLMTVLFGTLGMIGAQWHRRRDERTWRALLMLLLCGSLGVIAYLNLKAGTSFGWAFVTDDANHEARDRDYFFVLGFWAWGLWAGMGGIAIAERLRRPAVAGLVAAMIPVVFNWRAVDRRSEPEASLPREVATELLAPLPPNAVLFVAGDNDTYPLWYAQEVQRLRRDVTIVTLPLLAAPWYVEEVERRAHLSGPDAVSIATSARSQGRPVAVALTVEPETRGTLAVSWTVTGAVALDTYSLGAGRQHDFVVSFDSASLGAASRRIAAWQQGRPVRASTDPVNEYFADVLSCPRRMLDTTRSPVRTAFLDSLCSVR